MRKKMKKLLLLAMVLGLLVSGCAITTKSTIKESFNFTQFKTVKLEVKDEVNTPYSKEGVEEFRSIMIAHLGKTPVSVGKFGGIKVRQGLGYQVVTDNEDLSIKISILYFKPDNKALRIIVGWGSGKGGLKYVAEFSSKGKVLAVLEGGKSYGDVNVFGDTESTIYRGEESTRSFMIMHSVLDIGDFLRGENQEIKIPEPVKQPAQIQPKEDAITRVGVSLPKEAVVKTSSAELPKEIAAFSGKWRGKWNNKTVFSIEITKIDLEEARITYTAPETDMFPAVDFSETAKVILGENPKIQFSRVTRFKSGAIGAIGWFTFEMQKDLKALKGVAQWPKDTLKATMEKIE
jgi:hypothetical protein